MQVLTLPDGQDSVELMPVYGTAGVLLKAAPIASGGVSSVTAAPGDSGILVDNTDPNNPTIENTGVYDIAVDAPLQLISGGPHVEIGIDVSQLGGSIVRGNKNMPGAAAAADGSLACPTSVAFTPRASNANGGYFAVLMNGVMVPVGDGTKIGVAFYLSGDGGATARLMKAIVAGDRLYVNPSIAGFAVASTDTFDFLYQV